MLGCVEQAAVDELVVWLRGRFGSRLRELDLFGSHSRNEAHADSDVDIRVVVDDLSSAEGREIAHHAGDLLTKYDVILSPFALSTARMRLLRERERLIAREIDHDAIRLL